MDFQQYSTKFREQAKNAGYSEVNIIKCLDYAEKLFSNDVPVIYNTSHLSAHVGYNRKYIKRAALYTDYFYRDFKILKSNKKEYREISEPLPSLKEIQKWILNNILYSIPPSKYVKSYIPNRSIKDNAKYHKNQKIVLTLDIKEFFPSIKQDKVEIVFKELGYTSVISNLLAKLCCLYGSLPQGAPTSAYLSNIILRKFDKSIEEYCSENKIRYTRYADDLTFSGELDTEKLIEFVEQELEKDKLELNGNKTRIMKGHQKQQVTGIVVNKKLQAPREVRKELRQAAYYIDKYGLVNHIDKIGNKKSNYLKHLIGLSNFILFVNPNDEEAKSIKSKLISISKS